MIFIIAILCHCCDGIDNDDDGDGDDGDGGDGDGEREQGCWGGLKMHEVGGS